MIVVFKTDDGRKYWTKGYTTGNDFYTFTSFSRDGVKRVVHLNKKNVIEIAEIDMAEFPVEAGAPEDAAKPFKK